MLIMKKSQKKSLFLKLKYFLVFLFCCCSPHIYAQEDEKISFYLPFHSNQFTKNIEKFNEDLISTGFDNFEIKRSDIWQQYQQNIRTGELGVYFAAPHFSAWLIHKHDFIPLYRVDGNLKFVIASRIKDRDIFELSDLIEKKLCTQNPLNLDYLLINKSFKKAFKHRNRTSLTLYMMNLLIQTLFVQPFLSANTYISNKKIKNQINSYD